MLVPALGLVCVGLFIGAAIVQITQQHKQRSGDGEGSRSDRTAERMSPDETESE